MFFDSKTPRSTPGQAPAPDPSEAAPDEAAELRAHQVEEWRQSAQLVTRAWQDWLAANRAEQRARYTAFVAALANEERAAAEVERLVTGDESRL